MWIYVFIGIILIYALYKERQALGCPEIPDGTDCSNKDGKAVKGTTPFDGDSNEELLSKIDLASSYNDRMVIWRINFISIFILAVTVWFILYQRFPSELELTTLLIIGSSILCFVNGFYKFHLRDHVKENIVKSVKLLSKRL